MFLKNKIFIVKIIKKNIKNYEYYNFYIPIK